MDWDPLGERQELVPILAGEVGDRADRAFMPEVLVRKAGNVGHVDPRADDGAARGERPQRGRDQFAGGCEDDRRIERLRRRLIRRSRVRGAEITCELLRLGVVRARERVHLPALMDRDLADLVRCGAEAIQAEPRAVAGQLQRPVADQAAAQQRRGLDVGDRRGNLQAEPLIGDG